MSLYDAPNQQVVRADGSGPGLSEVSPSAAPTASETGSLDDMTKDELLAYAQELGVTPANAGMTKDQLREGVDAKLAEEPAQD